MFKIVNKRKQKYNNSEKNKTKKKQKEEEVVVKRVLYIKLKKHYRLLKLRL